MGDQLGEPQIKGNRNLIDAACEAAGAIRLFISREIMPVRKRLDQLESRLAKLESAKAVDRDGA